jgi:hypothetical protein
LIGPVESLTTLSDVDHLGIAIRQSQPDRNNWINITARCGGGVLRLTLELSSVSIQFWRGLAESDPASQSEKTSGGRQKFEHLPILSILGVADSGTATGLGMATAAPWIDRPRR